MVGLNTAWLILILVLGFAVSCLSGLLGIGGGIVMAPALLYLPPLLGLGALDMRQVTGLTITQGLFACISGAIRHDRRRFVDRRLALWMGITISISALTGSVASSRIGDETLMLLFAGLAVTAALLMLLPKEDREDERSAGAVNIPLAVLIAAAIGLLGGMVGQGGSFILVPLMLHALRLPTRVVIGTNLALVFFGSLAGFLGKLATGQIPVLLACLVAVAAMAGAQVGSAVSHRTSPRWLRFTLAAVVGAAAAVVTADALGGVNR
ncbi:MAG: sulfite exporter TauE/SafE family protein [Planctomycetes bacterium]|nr:sulfite exporter TauE/SafE family protein [Planctomycetota bacterium]